jgi:hypothetical protein
MGYFRFQKRIGIGSFGRVNISKSGVSLSEGVRGFHVTIGRTPRVTLGLPGSGISWTQTFGSRRRAPSGARQVAQPRPGWQVAIIIIALVGLLLVISVGGN